MNCLLWTLFLKYVFFLQIVRIDCSKASDAFIKLDCLFSAHSSVQWKSTPESDQPESSNAFVMLENGPIKQKSDILNLALYLKKKHATGIFACNASLEAWKVDSSGNVIKLTNDLDKIGLFFTNETSNIGSEAEPELKWSNFQEMILYHIKTITGYTKALIAFSACSFLITFIATLYIIGKLEQASIEYAKIAFIMEQGFKVRTLNKIRLQYIANGATNCSQ